MLDTIDRLVNSAKGRVVRLHTLPKVYLDEDGVTFDPVGPEIPVPDDDTLLFLLGQRYPGVAFDLPDQVPRLAASHAVVPPPAREVLTGDQFSGSESDSRPLPAVAYN